MRPPSHVATLILDAGGAFFIFAAATTYQRTSLLLWPCVAGAFLALAIFAANWRGVNRVLGMYGLSAQDAQIIKNTYPTARKVRKANIAATVACGVWLASSSIAFIFFGATQAAVVCVTTAFAGGFLLAFGVMVHFIRLRVRLFYGTEHDVAENHDV